MQKMQGNGCRNPTKCVTLARNHLKRLEKKWDPYSARESRSTSNEENRWADNEGRIMFELDFETKGTLTEGFRVFTTETNNEEDIDYARVPEENPSTITIFTDGSCLKDGQDRTAAGTGIWFGHDNPRNRAIRIPPYIAQTNNMGEAIAVLEAVRSVPKNQSIIVMSDSQITIDNLTMKDG
ncbi:hypothetical protein C0992_000055 [Termitomyces sp. T32_za158]|nr:hypothetical protein C0992_000055 [Termitomyces sp. T32_za158]